MESIHKFENMVEGWLKPLPHLPANGRKWLAENAWWLTLVGVIIAVLGIFGLYSALTALNNLNNSLFGAYYTAAVATSHGQLWTTSIYISMGLLVVTTAIEAMAISPLKAMSKKGWDLLFLAGIVAVASNLVGSILNVEVFGILVDLVGAAIGAYFLFEIRPAFKK